jgi:hypothetical protein
MHQSPLHNPYDALTGSYDPYAPITPMRPMMPYDPYDLFQGSYDPHAHHGTYNALKSSGDPPDHWTCRTGSPVPSDLLTGPARPAGFAH